MKMVSSSVPATARMPSPSARLPHGIACSVYFFDPEDNRIELYYTTPYKVRQPLGEVIDLDEPDAKLLAFAQSFEEKKGPPRGAQQPLA